MVCVGDQIICYTGVFKLERAGGIDITYGLCISCLQRRGTGCPDSFDTVTENQERDEPASDELLLTSPGCLRNQVSQRSSCFFDDPIYRVISIQTWPSSY